MKEKKSLKIISDGWDSIKKIKKAKPSISGMEDGLTTLGLKLEGRHHSGIDDARNIAQVALNLMHNGFEFK